MRNLMCLMAASAAAICAGLPVSAQTAYKAKDIVSHFAAPKSLGGARAICIGTESECAKDMATAPKRDGFDLVVKFNYNSDTLTRPARSNLDEFAKALKDPSLAASSFVVEGHTDGQGRDEYNLDLSMRRANAVVSYLQAQGVPTARLEAKGLGKQNPVSPDPMSSANRRVETRLRAE